MFHLLSEKLAFTIAGYVAVSVTCAGRAGTFAPLRQTGGGGTLESGEQGLSARGNRGDL